MRRSHFERNMTALVEGYDLRRQIRVGFPNKTRVGQAVRTVSDCTRSVRKNSFPMLATSIPRNAHNAVVGYGVLTKLAWNIARFGADEPRR